MQTAEAHQAALARLPQIYDPVAALLEDYRALEAAQQAQARLARASGAIVQWWYRSPGGISAADALQMFSEFAAAYAALPTACQPGQCDQGALCTGHCQGKKSHD